MRRGDTEDLPEAYEKAAQAYAINPDPDFEALLQDVEDRLEDEGIEFEPVARR